MGTRDEVALLLSVFVSVNFVLALLEIDQIECAFFRVCFNRKPLRIGRAILLINRTQNQHKQVE